MRISQSIVALVVLSLLACGRDTDTDTFSMNAETAQGPLQVYAVNYPLAWAAEQLLENAAEVHFPAPANVDPAFWQPDLNRIAAYQQADLILLNGANYASWLPGVSLPENRLVDTSRAFNQSLIAQDTGPAHSHGPAGNHSHGKMAFTVWMDLSLYVQQIHEVAAAAIRKFPQLAASIAAREEALTGQIAAMDRELMSLGAQLNGVPVLYSHPVYQYFEHRYKFNGHALHWEPDQLPSQQDWLDLAAVLQQHEAAMMFWENEPLRETRDRLKALNVEVIVFKPMGNRPSDGNFLSGMMANIERLRAFHQNRVR